jgi:hypothetical protein
VIALLSLGFYSGTHRRDTRDNVGAVCDPPSLPSTARATCPRPRCFVGGLLSMPTTPKQPLPYAILAGAIGIQGDDID